MNKWEPVLYVLIVKYGQKSVGPSKNKYRTKKQGGETSANKKGR